MSLHARFTNLICSYVMHGICNSIMAIAVHNTCQLHRCEYGDLSGKHNALTIGPLGMNRQTKAVVDVNLQLDGIYTSEIV